MCYLALCRNENVKTAFRRKRIFVRVINPQSILQYKALRPQRGISRGLAALCLLVNNVISKANDCYVIQYVMLNIIA